MATLPPPPHGQPPRWDAAAAPALGFDDFSAPLQALDEPPLPSSASATGSLSESGASASATDPGESTDDGDLRHDLDGASPEPAMGGFACPTCGHRFRRKNGLSRHMRSHTGEKPFACTLCKFRSTRTDSLQRHMKLHAHPEARHSQQWTSYPVEPPRGFERYGYVASAHPYATGRDMRQGYTSTRPYDISRPYDLSSHISYPMETVAPGLPAPIEDMGLGLGVMDPSANMSSILRPSSGPYASATASTSSFASPASLHSSHDLTSTSAADWTSPVPSAPPTQPGQQPSPSPLLQSYPFEGSMLPPPPISATAPVPSAPAPAPAPAPHHRAVWNAQQQDKGTSPLIIPPPSSSSFSSAGPGAVAPIPQIQVTEGFPTSPDFDFSRLFGATLADESALGFDAYIAQAASLFSPIKPASMEDQQQGSLDALFNDLDSGVDTGFVSHLTLPPDSADAPAPAAIPASNRHLSQFVLNFNRHMPFIHVPTIPQLYSDILDHSGRVKLSIEAKQIDCLKPCTEDVLRAMAIVGASYDGMAPSGAGFVPVPTDPDGADVLDATPLTVDWYGASELKNKLLADFSAEPPSTVRATFGPAGGSDSLFKDFLEEPTLLRRAQALMLLQFVSLFSQSRAHQNHARLLHGALITIGRELLTETAQRQVLEKKLTPQAQLSEYEQWRQWTRRMERKRTIWAIAVCDQLQSVLFRLPPFLQPSELDCIDLADLGSSEMWEAPSSESWVALRTSAQGPGLAAGPASGPKSLDSKVSIHSVLTLLLDAPTEDQIGPQLAQLGPCGYFVTALCLMSQTTETLRTDTEARKRLRQSAGLGPDPPGATEGMAVQHAHHALDSLGGGEKAALVAEGRELDRRLSSVVARLELGLARWRAHARVPVPPPGAGSAPWPEESVAISCATVHLMAQLRARYQPDDSWTDAPETALVRLLATTPQSRSLPDQTETLLVRVRRALRSPDPTAALVLLGVGAPVPHALAPPYTYGLAEPTVDPTSFRGFFPRLQ